MEDETEGYRTSVRLTIARCRTDITFSRYDIYNTLSTFLMISILRFSAEDTGTYTCFASNSLGADQAATRIYGMKGQIFLKIQIYFCVQPTPK